MLPLPDGQQVYVVDQGTGAPLVFIHGLPGIATDFAPLTNRLRTHFRCIAYDRAGYGLSAPLEKGRPIGIDPNVDDLEDIMDCMRIGKATLVGWSYGGHIALAAAQRMPDRVSRVVLLGSAGPAFRFPPSLIDYLIFRTPVGKFILRILLLMGPNAFRTQFNDAYGGAAPQETLYAFWNALRQPGALAQWIQEGAHWNPKDPPLTNMHQPCLIIHGDQDTRVPIDVARDLASRLEGATLVELVGAGHWPFATHTDLVEKHVRLFFDATES